MALQDLVGLGWPHPLSDQHATDDVRRHESLLWQVRRDVHRDIRPEKRRRLGPSRRASRAHMPRRVFLAVVLAWGLATAGLLAAILAIRWFG